MIVRLIEALQRLNPQPTPRELADALWLAQRLQAAPDAGPPPEGPGDVAPLRGDLDEPLPPETADITSGSLDQVSHALPTVAQAGLHLAPPAAGGPDLIRAPTVPALPRALHLARALRPLRVGAPSTTEQYLAEEATVQQIAETGIWRPEMRPAQERWLDLALVVDDSASMVVWQRTIVEFRAVLEQLAAFRDVRVWRMNTDDRLVLRTGGGPASGTGRSPRELIDPTHRRIILIISDCIGHAWQDGRVAGLLDRWGEAGPTAIVQPLPHRMWWRCGAGVEPVRIRAGQAGQPNNRLRVQLRDPGERPPGIAIPVLELDPRWLRPWAELVGHGGRQIEGMALFTGRPATPIVPDNGEDALSAMERVTRFRATSSPLAFQLAGYLAAAPLRLPVMRLVQRAMLPDSRPSHLAEVFLGNLLRKAVPADDPDEVEYEFHDGVRDVLLSTLDRTEAMSVLRKVWEVIRTRWGSTLDFRAMLSAVQEGRDDLAADPPFARVAAQVLARMGGPYARIAAQLAASADGSLAAPAADWQTEVAEAEDATPTERRALVVGGGLPPRNPDFTGRDDLLRATRRTLAEAVTALLPRAPHGLGGEGKSQLAVEYAYRYASDYDLIWWIPAEQITLARSSLADLARRLGTPLSDDINRTVQRLLAALRDGRPHRRWLLIYDNATDPDELIPLMPIRLGPDGRLASPLASGHVLITSRDRRWAGYAATAPVDVFERPESIAFLRHRAGQLSAGQADRLAERVGDLPLALEQAAAWHAETAGTAEEYLGLLDLQLEDEAVRNLPEEYPAQLAATVGLALESLRRDSPAAGQLAELWAFFGPDPVPLELLAAGSDPRLPPPLKDILANPEQLVRALHDIGRYALGRFDAVGASLQVHRLVRALLQLRLSGDAGRLARDRVHRILAAVTPDQPVDNEDAWKRRDQIAPHVVPAGVIDGTITEIREVAIDQMKYLYVRGDYEGSRALGEIALQTWRERLGPDDGSVLRAGRALANALRALGDIQAATALNADIYRRANARFGPTHTDTLITANSVGADLRLQGEFTQALELDQRTMRQMVLLFGRDHAETLRIINNVCIDLRLMGRFRQACDLDSDSLERLRRQLGSRHRSTLLGMSQLARDLHGLGRYGDALELHRQTLAGMYDTLGRDHHAVLQAEMSHAGTLRALGRHEEARESAEGTLRLLQRRFGDEHPDTLAARRSLAMACAAVGDAERGRLVSKAALVGYRRIMGADHPFFHACAADLARMLRALGDHKTAQVRDDGAVRGLHRSLGADHHYTLCCSVGLIIDLYRLGRPEAAYSRSKDVLARFQAGFGPDHPHTLAAAHNHRVIGRALGRREDGADPVTALAQALSPDHPEVLAAADGGLLECEIEPIPL